MNKFNNDLPMGSVVVGIHDRYSDNNGHYRDAVVWDGKEVKQVTYFSGNHSYADNDAVINASDAEIIEAGEWYIKNEKSSFRSRKSGHSTYLGCVVSLKGSRKARNRVPLLVTNYEDGYYCNRYNNQVASKIFVWDDELDSGVWVGSSCVNEVIECEKPSWYERVLK